MRLSGLTLLLFLFVLNCNSQNLLGYKSDAIEKFMNSNYPNMVMETNFRNDHYTYLKYSDNRSGSSTILFFMSDKDRCTSIKAIYDLSLKEKVIEELDRIYEKTGDLTWEDRSKRTVANINLLEEEWFISVSYKQGK